MLLLKLQPPHLYVGGNRTPCTMYFMYKFRGSQRPEFNKINNTSQQDVSVHWQGTFVEPGPAGWFHNILLSRTVGEQQQGWVVVIRPILPFSTAT